MVLGHSIQQYIIIVIRDGLGFGIIVQVKGINKSIVYLSTPDKCLPNSFGMYPDTPK